MGGSSFEVPIATLDLAVREDSLARIELRRCFDAAGASEEFHDLAVARDPGRGERALGVAVYDAKRRRLRYGWRDAAGECSALAAYGVHLARVLECGAGRLEASEARTPTDRFAIVRGRLAWPDGDGFALQRIRPGDPDRLGARQLTAEERELRKRVRDGGCACPLCPRYVWDEGEADRLAARIAQGDAAAFGEAARCLVETPSLVAALIENEPPRAILRGGDRDRTHEVLHLHRKESAARTAAKFLDHPRETVRSRATSVVLDAAGSGFAVPAEPKALIDRALGEGPATARMAVQLLSRMPARTRSSFRRRLLALLGSTKNPALAAALVVELSAAKLDPAGRTALAAALAPWTSHREVGRWARHALGLIEGGPSG